MLVAGAAELVIGAVPGAFEGGDLALDALSGRIKWLMRYPYYEGIHDSGRVFGGGHHYIYLDRPASPMLWYGTRPLLIGDHLFVNRVQFSKAAGWMGPLMPYRDLHRDVEPDRRLVEK